MEKFIKIWQANLQRHPEAVDFLLSRGVSEEQIRQFRVGWSSRVVKISKDGNVFYDGPRVNTGYVLFPLTRLDQSPTGFITRAVAEKEYYKWVAKSPGPWFFGTTRGCLEEIWRTKSVFLVEGAFDFFPLQRIYANTLCVSTANLSSQQYRFLERFVDKVFLYFDSDKTGQKSSDSIRKKAWNYFSTKSSPFKCIVLSSKFKDIGEAWYEWGDTKLKNYILDQVAYHDI